MPRKGPAARRELAPDPIYKSVVVTQLVNKVIQKGKRARAERLVYDALSEIEQKSNEDPVVTLKRAVENVRPALEVRSRRVGGATYQVPTPLRHDRGEALALRWLVTAARKRKGKPFDESLTLEVKDALNNTGAAIKKRDDVHKMAEANRAFAHFKF